MSSIQCSLRSIFVLIAGLAVSAWSPSAQAAPAVGRRADDACLHNDAQRLRLEDGSFACAYVVVVAQDKQHAATGREDESVFVKTLSGAFSDLKTLPVGPGGKVSPSVDSEKESFVVRVFGRGGESITLGDAGVERVRTELVDQRVDVDLPKARLTQTAVALQVPTRKGHSTAVAPMTVVLFTSDRQYFEFGASSPANPEPVKKKPTTVAVTKAGKPAAEGCGHDTAVQIPLREQPGRIACAYVLNAFNEELAEFQRKTLDEDELVSWLSECGEECDNVHPYQTSSHNQWSNRVSASGVMVIKVYGEFGHPMDLQDVGGIKARIYVDGEKRFEAGPSEEGTSFSEQMSSHISAGDFGDPIRVELLYDDSPVGSRHSWYRPASGFALDYTIATFAVRADGWTKFRNFGKLAFAPAMVRVQYRRYLKSQARTGYVFWNIIGLGPTISGAGQGSSNSTGLEIPGVIATTGVDIGGFEVGFGTTLNWEGSVALRPVITVNITEAFTRAFGWSGKYPNSLAEGAKDSEAKPGNNKGKSN